MLWGDIREGLKLRDIIQSKRINDIMKFSDGGSHKLVIQRQLGYKELVPQSGRWKLHNDELSECWFCGQ